MRATFSVGVQPIRKLDEVRGEKPRTVTPPNVPLVGYSNPQEPVHLTSEQARLWMLGQLSVFFYIRIDYDDVYPFTSKHHQWVCTKMDFQGHQRFCEGGRDD